MLFSLSCLICTLVVDMTSAALSSGTVHDRFASLKPGWQNISFRGVVVSIDDVRSVSVSPDKRHKMGHAWQGGLVTKFISSALLRDADGKHGLTEMWTAQRDVADAAFANVTSGSVLELANVNVGRIREEHRKYVDGRRSGVLLLIHYLLGTLQNQMSH